MARTKARRTFTKDFKLAVIREIDAGMTVAQAARVHEVHPETIRLWKRTHRRYGEKSFAGNGRSYSDEARIAQLERTLGQVTLENALLKKTLSALEEQRRSSEGRR